MPAVAPAPTPDTLRTSEVVAALSTALDLTEGMPEGHAVRTCLIGMRVAAQIDLPTPTLSSLFYALLLKDLGCSSNASKMAQLFQADDRAAKALHKRMRWTNLADAFRYVVRATRSGEVSLARVRRIAEVALGRHGGTKEMMALRCERGAAIALDLGFPDATADAIRTLDEHWDGRGQPAGLRGEAIPLLGRILQLAQTTEVFYSAYGPAAARRVARRRRGTWFDPHLVDAFLQAQRDPDFWPALADDRVRERLAALEPADHVRRSDEAQLDRVAEAFAGVIDAKSPWTYRHSTEVARYAVGIAEELGLDAAERRRLRRAALLHDLGKLGVSSAILDKPGRLTDAELAEVRRHPDHTLRILERVAPFRDLAEVAAMHHERVDGRGYHRGVGGDALPLEARILAVADQFEALSAERPYRERLERAQVLAILERDLGTGIDADVFAALQRYLERTAAPGRRAHGAERTSISMGAASPTTSTSSTPASSGARSTNSRT